MGQQKTSTTGPHATTQEGSCYRTAIRLTDETATRRDSPGRTGIAEIEQFNRNGNPLGVRRLLVVGPYDDSNGVRHGFLFTRNVGVGLGEVP